MDYKKARQTRGKSLLQLIAEKKFKEGEGLGASIAGAVSDKFKARAVGFQEKFDPLNIVRGLTGKGTFGHIATTLAGRAMGRSESDIKYFGGFARKNKARLDNSKKDPLFTTVGAGAVVKLRTGDGIATIMGKLYNFMEKNQEVNKRNYELEVAFRKEQIEEDERRHKKLIDSILNRTDTQKQAEPEDEVKSFIEKLLDGIKNAFASLVSGISGLLPALAGIGGAIMSAIAKNIGTIFQLLAPSVSQLIKSVLGSVLRTFVTSISSGIIRNALLGPLGVALAALGVGAVVGEYQQHLESVKGGPEYERLKEQQLIEETQIHNKYGNPSVQNEPAAMKKELKQFRKDKAKQLEDAIKKNEEEVLIPNLAKEGYKPVEGGKRDDKGFLKFINDKGEEPSMEVYEKATGRKSMIDESVDKALGLEQNQSIEEKLIKEGGEAIDKAIAPLNKLKSEPESKVTVESAKESASLIPMLQTPDVFNQGAGGTTTYVASTTNNIGGSQPKIYDMGATSMRNEDVPVRLGIV